MDFTLRCNSLKCRSPLNERAVVTTCSHIFCTRCSDSLGLSGAASNNRICPACETRLINNDDAVLATLSPSEDYKTSVLSGLSPSIIMECAGRGLAFYSYQATQEIVYQEYLAKSLTEKYTSLSGQMDQIIHDANAEISSLRTKLSNFELDQTALRKENDRLLEAYKDKNRQHQKSQAMYDRLHKELRANDSQRAAEMDAEHAISGNTSDHVGTSHNPGVRAFAQPRAFSRAPGDSELVQPRRTSGGRGFDLSNTNHATNSQQSFNGQVWNADHHQGTPARSRLPVGSPQSHRTGFQHEGHQRQGWHAQHGSQQEGHMRQPLGATETNRQNTPLLYRNQGFANYKPPRQSNLANMMAP